MDRKLHAKISKKLMKCLWGIPYLKIDGQTNGLKMVIDRNKIILVIMTECDSAWNTA